MANKGDLHVDEEFGRAKRNLLWFCSFAIVLWMVTVPSDGFLEPTILGSSAKLPINWLRFSIWVGCVYCIIGFYRQVRNVDRINSDIIYTDEFDNIHARLDQLRTLFEEFGKRGLAILDTAPKGLLPPANIDRAKNTILVEFSGALAGVDTIAKRISSPGPVSVLDLDQLPQAWNPARERVQTAIRREFEILVSSELANERDLEKVALLVKDASLVVEDVKAIRYQFDRLSTQIRADHQILYRLYDKYLSYGMFALATVASGWVLEQAIWAATYDLGGKILSAALRIAVNAIPGILAVLFLMLVYHAERYKTRVLERRAARKDALRTEQETGDRSNALERRVGLAGSRFSYSRQT